MTSIPLTEPHAAKNGFKVAVMGAGAVGCYFGGMLARAGHEVVLIARPQHVEAVARAGLRMQTTSFDEHGHTWPPAASPAPCKAPSWCSSASSRLIPNRPAP